jgi:hypothetical protein
MAGQTMFLLSTFVFLLPLTKTAKIAILDISSAFHQS